MRIDNWKGLGKLPSPELSGVRSMSSGAPCGCNVKFCRMEVKYKKSSIRASGSPRHSRRPVWAGGPRAEGEVKECGLHLIVLEENVWV